MATVGVVAAAIVALKDPEVRRKLEDLGQDIPTPEQMAPAAFTAFQKAEVAKWTPIIEKAGVKIEFGSGVGAALAWYTEGRIPQASRIAAE